ncbi:ABC transporter transmembrane region domain-containing protein [Trichoderma breve]|uniref:ABC transporter transmembrane region domain-containing protein n=1 Tax=Trichoderma breve TaxID=2034170 RepID=A0A9W9BDQ0_9HYPO|nr:ABC transporter transmembrane region domain-containing protein [Trichoderma breve]KAJ4859449.1 ABC transporter transmembrane region domain-containing protein [Trichoderma breve]
MDRPPGKRDGESSGKAADADATYPPVAGHEVLKSRRDRNEETNNGALSLSKSPHHESTLAGLKLDEAQIIKAQLDSPNVGVKYLMLYRYADVWDFLIITISAVCAIAAGAILPLLSILFGQLTSAFQRISLNDIAYHDFEAQLNKNVLYFVYIGIAEFATVYVSTVGFIYTGEHITQKIRQEYLKAILRQNIAYFDNLGAGEITTRITADTNLIQDGISQKIGLTLTAIATFIAAFIIAYVKYWKLALICTSTIVCLLLIMSGGSHFIIHFSKLSFQSLANGSTVAEEVISSIRTAIAFGTHDRLARQYDSHLIAAERSGIKMQIIQAIMIGSLYAIMFWNYGLGFWQGSRFLVTGEADVGQILTILMAILTGSYSLGNVAPNSQAFNSAVAAAAKIYSTIDRQSPLDPTAEDGETLQHVEGTVELRNVKHRYPSRPDILVMDDISILIPAGRTTALVGPSGSGKSTIIGLVERFYNPVGGEILLDGHNIQSLNLRWLRNQISLVGQEPVLFSATIFENIKFGLTGTPFENEPEEVTQNRIEEAAKMASAHTFITSLPDGYGTIVGERGFLLSGGQKQRIAIARAIVGDPKILLLDEATSALDTKSEEIVQAALDKAAEGRTIITIAHRLSTIKTADNIVVVVDGKVAEQGTHEELLRAKGEYFKLVEAQKSDNISRIPTSQSGTEKMTKAENDLLPWSLIKFTASFNRRELLLMIIGLAFAILAGCGQPSQAVIYSKAINTLALPPPLYEKLRHDANFWSLMLFILGIAQFVLFSIQGVCFGVSSERLLRRARSKTFRVILRQDTAFFDEHTTGALTSFLSTETKYLSGISGVVLGTILMVSTTLTASMVVALAIGWKLALVCISIVPVLLFCGFYRVSILARFQAQSKKAYERSASYACEATSAIRTVASLSREVDVFATYKAQLDEQARAHFFSVLKSSIFYALSQALTFFCMALGFWYGGTLLGKHEYTIFQFFVCFSEVIYGAQAAGSVFSNAPDIGKAKSAAAELKNLFSRKPSIDVWSKEGNDINNVAGSIEFRNVHFRYPTRPTQSVLSGLSFTVKPGQFVALVGASGCGKSTTIALLERFYDALSGCIYVDGKDISQLNVNSYRSHLALVSQEPTLYQGTIRSNILLGSNDLSVTEEQVIKVCKMANIYDFILSLPEGLDTLVGNKGGMLSGGQKQRVAIARALLRDPKVLLLDEATSALDSESERVVQAALDAAMRGRTTIAVAHRLSTIQKADVIYVFDQGRVVESGTHHQLMKQKGRYHELVYLQSIEDST